MPIVKVAHLTEAERDRYLELGGLHGSELNGAVSTTDEYDANLAHLLVLLSEIGTNGIVDCPYFVAEFAEPDFFPCVEVVETQILTPKLLHLVCLAVARMEELYRVDVCNALGYINDEFNVIVEHNVIYAFSENNEILKSVGLTEDVFSY